MYARPWQRVNDFYFDIVRANLSLSLLFGPQVGNFVTLLLVVSEP